MRSIEEKSKSILDKLSADIGDIDSRVIGNTKIALSQVIGNGEIFVNVEMNINEKSSMTLIFLSTNDEKTEEERDGSTSYFFAKIDEDLIKKLIEDNKDGISFASKMGQNIFAAYSIDENLFLGSGIIQKTDPVRH